MKLNFFDWLGRKIDSARIGTISVSENSQEALKELAFFIAVSHIANAIGKCKIRVYERNKEVKDLNYYLWNVSPNENESSSQFLHKVVEKMFYEGEAIVVPIGDNLYSPDSYEVDNENPTKSNIYKNLTFGEKTMSKAFKSEDIFRFKMDDHSIKTLVDNMYCNYGTVVSQAMKSYKQTNGKKYQYKIDNYPGGTEKFNEDYKNHIQEKLKKYVDSDSAVFPTFKGTSLEPEKTEGKKDATDIVSLRKEVFEMIGQAMKVPTSIMLCNITNLKEVTEVYLTFCIDPIADMISEEITRKYFGFTGWKNGNYVKVDTSEISHADILDISNEIYNIIGSGVMNIDGVRERLGLPILNTKFSKQYYISKNFDLAENVAKGGGDNE